MYTEHLLSYYIPDITFEPQEPLEPFDTWSQGRDRGREYGEVRDAEKEPGERWRRETAWLPQVYTALSAGMVAMSVGSSIALPSSLIPQVAPL